MADVTLSYKGSDILELSDGGSATLKTGGKYCEADIELEYVKPSGGGSLGDYNFIREYTISEDVSLFEITKPSNLPEYTEYAMILNCTLSSSTPLVLYGNSVSGAKTLGQTNTTTSHSDAIYLFKYEPSGTVGNISYGETWRGILKRSGSRTMASPVLAAGIDGKNPFPLILKPNATTATILQGSSFALYGR